MRSKVFHLLYYLLLLPLVSGCATGPSDLRKADINRNPAQEPPRSLAELKARTAEALRERDLDAFKRLFRWDGLDEDQAHRVSTQLAQAVEAGPGELRVEPPDPFEKIEFTSAEGYIYRLNLKLLGTVKIVHGPNRGSRWPFGRRGRYYEYSWYAVVDSLSQPGDDGLLQRKSFTREEQRWVRAYYHGVIEEWDLLSDALRGLKPGHPTRQQRSVRFLLLVLDDALKVESDGRIPRRFLNAESRRSHQDLAYNLRSLIAHELRQPLPACARPLGEFFLERETLLALKEQAPDILSFVGKQ